MTDNELNLPGMGGVGQYWYALPIDSAFGGNVD